MLTGGCHKSTHSGAIVRKDSPEVESRCLVGSGCGGFVGPDFWDVSRLGAVAQTK